MTTIVKQIKNIFIFQSIRFAVSSGIATASHWFVMAILIVASTTPTVATAVGALIGAIVNYFLQRKITFRSSSANSSTLLSYIAVCIVIWFLNFLFFFIFYQIALLSTVVSQGITTLSVALISYFLYKRIVFNEHQPQSI
ncbi:MAG: polysaccharide biosynthesis protein GtrA [Gammaproteobacteria bacterium]|nr:MAG: polysaccharide biosynthesis protein GtrA [Gammaproteobacteria bacterium]